MKSIEQKLRSLREQDALAVQKKERKKRTVEVSLLQREKAKRREEDELFAPLHREFDQKLNPIFEDIARGAGLLEGFLKRMPELTMERKVDDDGLHLTGSLCKITESRRPPRGGGGYEAGYRISITLHEGGAVEFDRDTFNLDDQHSYDDLIQNLALYIHNGRHMWRENFWSETA